MKTFNKIISIFIIMIIMFNVFSFNTSADDDVKSIYRESGISQSSNNKDFQWSIEAKADGSIIIDVVVLSNDVYEVNNLGNVEFDENVITLTNVKKRNSNVKVIRSFKNDCISYSIAYGCESRYVFGETLCEFYLTVNSEFLNTEQVINVFGNETRIPFGDSKYLTYSELRSENEQLKKDIESLTNKVADVNNDGIITIEDALTTLQYYTRNTLLGENTTWEEIINKS